MEWFCKKCDGMGMCVVERADGGFLAEECECRALRRNLQLHSRANIPERYKDCTLQNYVYDFPGAHRSLQAALIRARGFVGNYPHNLKGTGLLFTGDIGTGKTHLAVGIIQALTLEKGVPALFCDHRELIKAIHNSYNPRVAITEMDVLRPVFEAEILVLDELGSAKKTEWVSDMVEHILNTRYNDKRTTIVTTNYPNLPPSGTLPRKTTEENRKGGSAAAAPLANVDTESDDIYRRVAQLNGDPHSVPSLSVTPDPDLQERESRRKFRPLVVASAGSAENGHLPAEVSWSAAGITLGDRIGERMRSRLIEMCVTAQLRGVDYRQGAKRAQFR